MTDINPLTELIGSHTVGGHNIYISDERCVTINGMDIPAGPALELWKHRNHGGGDKVDPPDFLQWFVAHYLVFEVYHLRRFGKGFQCADTGEDFWQAENKMRRDVGAPLY